jgi:hypothetical protein
VNASPAAPRPPGRRWRSGWIAAAALGLLLGAIPAATTQEPPAEDAVARENAIIVATLVRTTLVALHQANVTGNYTVLRDLAAPSFRDKNTAADLARIFAPIRDENIDLGVIVVREPELARQPAIADNGMLHIDGTLRTRPTPVRFEFLFQPVDNAWRLFGVSITPTRLDAAPGTGTAPDASLIGQNAPPPLSGSLVPPIPKPRPPTAPQQ